MTNYEVTYDPKRILEVFDQYKNIIPTIVGESWKDVYAGDVIFQLPNGWQLVVFNDCDCWDYVDSIRMGAGHQVRVSFWNCPEFDEIHDLRDWEPNNVEEWMKL